MDIEKLIEDLRVLLKQYGEKIPYGELVDAPWPYSRAGDLVWQDPEPYFIEQAATALSTLQAENEKLRETVDKYATAARAIALNLKPFCDESLPYDEMIADAARKASDEMERVKRLYESEKEDFIDFACSGVPNLSPYCMNRRSDCVDERGWCRSGKCHGFSRERGQKEE